MTKKCVVNPQNHQQKSTKWFTRGLVSKPAAHLDHAPDGSFHSCARAAAHLCGAIPAPRVSGDADKRMRIAAKTWRHKAKFSLTPEREELFYVPVTGEH